jgi:hypothetical protein
VNMVLPFMRSSVSRHRSVPIDALGWVWFLKNRTLIRRFSNFMDVTTKKKLIRNDPDENRGQVSVVLLCAAESTGNSDETATSILPRALLTTRCWLS